MAADEKAPTGYWERRAWLRRLTPVDRLRSTGVALRQEV